MFYALFLRMFESIGQRYHLFTPIEAQILEVFGHPDNGKRNLHKQISLENFAPQILTFSIAINMASGIFPLFLTDQ